MIHWHNTNGTPSRAPVPEQLESYLRRRNHDNCGGGVVRCLNAATLADDFSIGLSEIRLTKEFVQ